MMKILSFSKIYQERSNENRSPKLGRGFSIANRMNLLSYIIIIGIIAFGIVGVWQKFDGNPLKWD